jgi:hypothetical protein
MKAQPVDDLVDDLPLGPERDAHEGAVGLVVVRREQLVGVDGRSDSRAIALPLTRNAVTFVFCQTARSSRSTTAIFVSNSTVSRS